MHRPLVLRIAALIALSTTPLVSACGGQDAVPGEEQNAKATVNGRVEVFVGEDAQW